MKMFIFLRRKFIDVRGAYEKFCRILEKDVLGYKKGYRSKAIDWARERRVCLAFLLR